MTSALEQALHSAKDWLDGLDDRPVQASADMTALRSRFVGSLPEAGTPPADVVSHLATDSKDGLLGSAGGRFFAWVIGGGLDSALAADWLVSTWDQNAALYGCGPATAVIEEVAGEWLKELFDLPREASFAFTTGCQLAHMTGLASARHALLQRVGWDVESKGLFSAPPITLLANAQRHSSVERAVRFLGLGTDAITPLETDQIGRILPAALEHSLRELSGPSILVLNAADLNVGACDQFSELIPMARDAGVWVHVDGAFGLFARASRARRHLVAGIEMADSWATDGHKWLNVPYDCGIAIIRDREAHKAAMTVSASYIEADHAARDQIDWNPEWSRRARGVPVYAALKELGRSGIEALIDRSCDHCAALVEGIGALHGAEVLASPTLNQGLLRFSRAGATDEENDLFTDNVIERINATGEAFFSGTTWQGRQAMRVSVVNWRTTPQDVRRAIAATARVLNAEPPG
ncbi:MAG: pyridoxal-dependent decarboxylase [Alphaproteobacteria bacterium]|jgi:glutamate/tyrosine decarboxylase-like PLP-dependent enzyme|nr:pyridoxal-dependent decarboxylase [Alphaproteobacteria bacterium]